MWTLLLLIIIIIVVVVVGNDTYYWVHLFSDYPFQVYYKVRQLKGVQKETISEGVGGLASQVFFPGAPSKIDGQAISFFTASRCFKAKLIVSIHDLLFAVG